MTCSPGFTENDGSTSSLAGTPPAEQRRQMERAARAAVSLVQPGEVLGVGTGRTVAAFIDALQSSGIAVPTAWASSRATAFRLSAAGFHVLSGYAPLELPLYIDGADEIDPQGRMIKGGGGAHTMEKLLATAARRFVCIADASKLVDRLGDRAVPLEVLPAATQFVSARLESMGGRVRSHPNESSDSGNALLDVEGLDLSDPERVEYVLDAIPGVIECGVFALRRADVALIGTADGVREIDFA